jgi:hypothetical protein
LIILIYLSVFSWLDHVNSVVKEDTEDNNMSWPAFHANRIAETCSPINPGISALLPLFPDQAKSDAMIRHSMTVV